MRTKKVEAPSDPKAAAPQRPAEYGTYQHVDSLPVLLNRTPCAQPDTSRAAGVSGSVMVAVLIGEDGRVREVRVVQAVQSTPGLEAPALECVRAMVFRPAMRSGRPVAYWMAVPVTFEP
jgi:protein TonB